MAYNVISRMDHGSKVIYFGSLSTGSAAAVLNVMQIGQRTLSYTKTTDLFADHNHKLWRPEAPNVALPKLRTSHLLGWTATS